MKFMFATCKVCKRIVFNEKELIVFKRTKPLEQVHLEGQQPWTGMICICSSCLTAITEAYQKEDEDG